MKLLFFIALTAIPAAAQIQRSSIKGHPVTMVQQTTTTRTLSDGSHLANTSTETFYRNAQGVYRSDTATPIQQGRQGFTHTAQIINMDTREATYWTTVDDRPQQSSISRNIMQAATPAPDALAGSMPKVKWEELGTGEENGIPCKRRRITTNYPANSYGNDRAYSVVQEQCESPDCGLLTQTIDNPASGHRVTTLQSLTPGEPDPSVFQPPADMQEKLRSQRQ